MLKDIVEFVHRKEFPFTTYVINKIFYHVFHNCSGGRDTSYHDLIRVSFIFYYEHNRLFFSS